ncbi:nitrite reductase small subunit NirD [Mycobacterium sp. 3519A]|jgi:nitrite reductase (NADH) small subunit|uniref:nitrite reductase small subunit NirD n=1 Tax=Mycobacterium sp. 3519A TaxID=2057184 RepID=UPI001F2169F6|nr:nitrite reductase small subunit NirD [Mycobacterium sp. 3519A]
MTLANDIEVWTTACAYDFLIPNRGVGVLLPDGAQAALFRLDDGSLHAVGNIDPFSGAAVMSRGIVGDRGGRATVQTPIKKQAFALDDGTCLDDPEVALPVFATRVVDGQVQVGAELSSASRRRMSRNAALPGPSVSARRGN